MNQVVVVSEDGFSMEEYEIELNSIDQGVNECASPILNGCEQGCVNTLTSFRCTCRSGYKLAPNGKNCWGKGS